MKLTWHHEADLISLWVQDSMMNYKQSSKTSLNAKKIHLDCDYGSIEKL